MRFFNISSSSIVQILLARYSDEETSQFCRISTSGVNHVATIANLQLTFCCNSKTGPSRHLWISLSVSNLIVCGMCGWYLNSRTVLFQTLLYSIVISFLNIQESKAQVTIGIPRILSSTVNDIWKWIFGVLVLSLFGIWYWLIILFDSCVLKTRFHRLCIARFLKIWEERSYI